MSKSTDRSTFAYRAFISYSHADKAWAEWLHKALETYRVPPRLVGKETAVGIIPRRLAPIFRDRDELASATDLGRQVNAALAKSEALVVICSPQSATSRWVNGEVLAFKRLGRTERIFCLIVDGEPDATDKPGHPAEECFVPSLRFQLDSDGEPTTERTEPIAADARPGNDGKADAKLKLIAGLLDVGFDELKQREQHRRMQRMLALMSLSLGVMVVTVALAVFALISRHDAQRRQAQAENIVGFMLGDLREKLATVGRLDLMVAVDDKVTAYFNTLHPRDLNERALEQQARLLAGIGQVRLDQGHAAQAMAAFRHAYDRSRELYRRQAGNGQRLFDLAQAEYWIGFAFWRQGRLDDAEMWLSRYRDSAVRLAALDRSNFAWQREVAYGQSNLATLAMARNHDQQAEQIFKATYQLYLGWMETHPHDTDLRDEAANTASYLGTLAMQDGRLSEALVRFTEQVADISANRVAEPNNAQWKSEWPNARLFLAQAQANAGQIAAARRGAADAAALAEALSKQDPTNQEWQLQLGTAYWWQARLGARWAPTQSEKKARSALRIFAAAYAAAPTESVALLWLVRSQVLLGELACRRGALDQASTWLSRADAELRPALASQENKRAWRLLPAELHLWQGTVAAQRGNLALADAQWFDAEHLLRNGSDSPTFDRLDLLVRVLLALRREAVAAPYLARLRNSGYVPLDPWQQTLVEQAAAESK